MKKTHVILFATTALAFAAISAPAAATRATQSETDQQADPATGDVDVIVTAQRREQTLLEVPQSISVVSGDTLERQQATSFMDYAQLVPGLNLTQENPGETRLILRGLNTGSVSSTVAVYGDDVPFGSSGSLSNGGILSGDFDTFDVARVEVLRGPQGTLYGSNALGGVIKYITNAPRMDAFTIRGQAGVETVEDGGTGYSGNAVVNIPLGDTLAVRASGFFRRQAGYIDTIGQVAENVNESDSYGGRVSLLFQPTDSFSVRLLALAQNIRADSPSSFIADPRSMKPVNPLTGRPTDGTRLRYARIAELNEVDYRLYNGTINYDFGPANLTSVTSYATQTQRQLSDISTNAINGTTNAAFPCGTPPCPPLGTAFQNDVKLEKFTQEIRLASSDNDSVEWLIGGYYTHEKTQLFQRYLPFVLATEKFVSPTGGLNLLTGGTFKTFVLSTIDAKYEEIAAFGSATVHLGPRFDITAGGRYSHNKQSATSGVIQFDTGAPNNGASSENVFTWSVSPRFELNDRASIYARVAKGYRPGGPTFVPFGAPADYPTQFNSDSVISYEAGFRGETRDRSFSLDLSAFYVDWDDILIVGQVMTIAGNVTVNTNGRRARSYGVEATATLRPIRGFTTSLNFAYTNAKLIDATLAGTGAAAGPNSNATGGIAGDPLPFSPEFTVNVSSDYEWSIGNSSTAFVGANLRLISDQYAGFSPPFTVGAANNTGYRAVYGRRPLIDGFPTIDLRAGATFSGFTLSAYVKNLTDQYGVNNAGGFPGTAVPASLGGSGLQLLTVASIRPRTIGAQVGIAF